MNTSSIMIETLNSLSAVVVFSGNFGCFDATKISQKPVTGSARNPNEKILQTVKSINISKIPPAEKRIIATMNNVVPPKLCSSSAKLPGA